MLEASHAGLDLLILDAPALFDRAGGPYLDRDGLDYPDNFRRFAGLSLAAAEIAAGLIDGWVPDLVHVHDWQAALTPLYMRYDRAPQTPSVFTIHNIAFQGRYGAQVFPELALPPQAFAIDGVEFYGDVSFMKAGLAASTAITTVSPSYAQEILTPEFGMGFEGVLSARVDALSGIVNGIDTDIWNPATDAQIVRPYDPTGLAERARNKAALRTRFGLVESDGPLFCVISRLTLQKGMDVLAEEIETLVSGGGQLAVLGSGDPALEAAFRTAAAASPGQVGLVLAMTSRSRT